MREHEGPVGTAAPTTEPAGARWLDADAAAPLELTVNGERVQWELPPRRTLADALRGSGLTGTRLGCEHGVCGACTVLLDGAPVRSCLLFAHQAAGRRVDTVEGLAAADGTLHPLQQAFHARGALQCGFCTAGFLMAGAGLLAACPDATEEQALDALSGNLCRCTGGKQAVQAVLDARDALRRR